MSASPTVAIVLPVRDGADLIGDCLERVMAQTYEAITEILVVDGNSTDATREVAARTPTVKVINNPALIQSSAMNVALAQTTAEVIVRVDVRARLAPDYVMQCLRALEETGAAVVGGAQVPVGAGWMGSGIAAAFASVIGAGPASFRRPGRSAWVDTAYMGAFKAETARLVGGYDEGLCVNEDAEFARRMAPHGGVWLDGRIQSTYVVRSSLVMLARQYLAYGRGRGEAIASGRSYLSPRQLAAPALVLGMVGSRRRAVGLVYGAVLAIGIAPVARRRPRAAAAMAAALPVMHVCWAIGFYAGLGRTLVSRGRARMTAPVT